MRLANTIYHASFIPILLFIYAWTARASIHWIVLSVLHPFRLRSFRYLRPMSNLRRRRISRDFCIRGCGTGGHAIDFRRIPPLTWSCGVWRVGLGVGNSVLGVLALVVTAVPFAFLKWGGTLRKRWVVKL